MSSLGTDVQRAGEPDACHTLSTTWGSTQRRSYMRSVASPRKLAAAFVVVVAVGLGSIGVSGAATRATAAAKPPKTVTATQITRRKGTLATGSSVRAGAVSGPRVVTDA